MHYGTTPMADGSFFESNQITQQKAKLHMNCNCHRATNVDTTIIIGCPIFVKNTTKNVDSTKPLSYIESQYFDFVNLNLIIYLE